MANQPAANDFDAYYYQHGLGANPYERNEGWLNFFQSIADRIISDIAPASVLDAGCALGFLVEGFRKRNVETWGIDISEYAIENAHPSIKPFCALGSIGQPFPRKYDLIVTIEVLEHMPKAEAEAAIANLCAHTDDILFSSTPFDYKEATHYNVQPPEYWAEQFARHGFFRDVDFDASFITAWAVRFRRKAQPLHKFVFDYERKYWLLQKENYDLRALVNEMRNTIRNAEADSGAARQTKEECQSTTAALQKQHEEDTQALNAAQTQIGNLQTENDSLRSTHTALQADIISLQEENAGLHAKITSLQEESAGLHAKITSLQAEKSALQSDLEEQKSRLSAIENSRTWKSMTRLYTLRKKITGAFRSKKEES